MSPARGCCRELGDSPRSHRNAVAEQRLNSASTQHHPLNHQYQSSGKQAFHLQPYNRPSTLVFAERLTTTRGVMAFPTQECRDAHLLLRPLIIHSFPSHFLAVSLVPLLVFQTSLQFSI